MKTWIIIPVIVVLAVRGAGLYTSAYTVVEGKQAIITQFGKPIGAILDPGLHFKWPFLQEVHYLERPS